MSRKRIGVIIAVVLILLVVGYLIAISYRDEGQSGGIHGFNTSSVEITVTYKEGSSELASEFDFLFDTVKKETTSVSVEIDETSTISVSNYSSSSDCRLILYKGSSEIWQGTIQDGCVFSQLVKEYGKYELVLEMEEGEGKGKVTIS